MNQKEKMTNKYGNLSLGQVSKMLITIIGRNATLTTVEEHNRTSVEKELDRMFTEQDRSFSHFRPSENTSAVEYFRKFTAILKKDYSFSEHAASFIQCNFWGVFRNALRGNGTNQIIKDIFKIKDGGLVPYEMPTVKLCLTLINWSLGYLGFKYENGEEIISKKTILQLLTDTYEIIFDEIIKKTSKNNDDFYEQLFYYYQKNYLSLDADKHPDFKQAIKRYRKGTANITWKTLKIILDFINSKIEKELVHRLISLYLLKNTEAALKDDFKIDQKEIFNIKQDVLKWAKGELPSEPQSETQCFLMTAGKYDLTDLSILQRNFIDPDYEKQITAIEDSFTYLWGKTTIDPEKTEQLIETMEKECPNCGVFFGNWARARLNIFSIKFDGSLEDYDIQKQALEYYNITFNKGRNYAGAYLNTFLEECIAATVYFNPRRIQDIPKVIDKNHSLKTPITDDVKETEKREASYGAKQYYEYGYALNLFEQMSSETYFLHFHAEKHFWRIFNSSSFIHTKQAEQKCSQDILKAEGFHPSYIDTSNPEEIKKWITLTKHTEALWKITEKSINTRMEFLPGHNVQYTPLSIAIFTRQLDIAEHYLSNFANTLDVTVINTHGSTALLEALTQYKICRFFAQDKSKTERYKKIIMKIIELSSIDSLYAKTVKKQNISVLEEAINTCDDEIVKAIKEKMG